MKAMVIEDSRLAREGLMRMLQQFPQLTLIDCAEHAEAARAVIEAHRPDLLFLDIHMPGESGFELLASLEYQPKVVFTTAYSEYAIRSFDYNTVDYLLKPISEERLSAAIDKLFQGEPEKTETSEARLDATSRIFVKDGERCHLVEVARIRYIESCKNYVQIFFDDEKVFVKKSMTQVQARLPERMFFRASRQYIVNLSSIRCIEQNIGDSYNLAMDDGKLIEASRRNAARLKEMLSL